VTLSLLVLLLLAAAGLRRRRRLAASLLGVALVLFVGIGCGPMTGWMLAPLQDSVSGDLPRAWATHPVIVVLGAGVDADTARHEVHVAAVGYGRVTRAAQLYRDCRLHAAGCTVLLSGGDPQLRGLSEAAANARELVALGVDAADLLLEERSLDTWQNAQYTAGLLAARGTDAAVLVSSGIHLRRAQLYFSHFGIKTTPVSGDYVSAIEAPIPLAYNFALTDFAIHEYSGIARYYVYEFLGWNVAAQQRASAVPVAVLAATALPPITVQR
jgi:uncharacterized SAM-binding protein YcdF (DUF218 family)